MDERGTVVQSDSGIKFVEESWMTALENGLDCGKKVSAFGGERGSCG